MRSSPTSMKTLLLLHCTHHTPCCAVGPLLIFGMSSNEVAINPESLSTCLTKMGRNLSSLLLLPSLANPYQRVNNSSSFRSLVICSATALVSISAIFVEPHRYLFIILESGNMFLNSLEAWFAVLKGRLCSSRKREISRNSTFTTFWSKFVGAELSLRQNRLVFFDVVQHPQISYDLICPCVYWYYFPLNVQHRNHFHTPYIKQNLHLSGISEWIWIYYTKNC